MCAELPAEMIATRILQKRAGWQLRQIKKILPFGLFLVLYSDRPAGISRRLPLVFAGNIAARRHGALSSQRRREPHVHVALVLVGVSCAQPEVHGSRRYALFSASVDSCN